jgi:hypothetical protein
VAGPTEGVSIPGAHPQKGLHRFVVGFRPEPPREVVEVGQVPALRLLVPALEPGLGEIRGPDGDRRRGRLPPGDFRAQESLTNRRWLARESFHNSLAGWLCK